MTHQNKSKTTALLLIDWINPFDFEGGEALLRHARQAVTQATQLANWCRGKGTPVIVINDNFGQWSSDRRTICERARQQDFGGREIAREILDLEYDHFVLKPRHSAFHHTVLDLLLDHLGTKKLILSGLATNICCLFTANDAHLRNLKLWIPPNCSAAETIEDHEYALHHFRKVLGSETHDFSGTES